MRPVPGRLWLGWALPSVSVFPVSAALDGVVSGLGNPTFSFTILPLATYGVRTRTVLASARGTFGLLSGEHGQ